MQMTPQEAITQLEDCTKANKNCFECPTMEAMNLAIEALEFQQSLVRCGDCKHYQHILHMAIDDGAGSCTVNNRAIKGYLDYCSYGERGDEE